MTLDAQSIGDAGMYKFGKTVVLKVTVFFLTSIQTFIQVMASFSLVALSTHDCCKRFFSDNPLLIVRRRAIFAVEEIGSVSWEGREGWLDLGLFADKPSVTNISQELPKSPNNIVNVIGRLKKVQPTKPTRSDGQNKDVSYWFCTHAGAGKALD